MKKIFYFLLKIYSLVLITTLLITGLRNISRPVEVVIPLLFLPVFGYLSTSFSPIRKRIRIPLLIYSLIFSLIVTAAEVINIRNLHEAVILILMLPFPLFFINESKRMLIRMFAGLKTKLTPKVDQKEPSPEVGKIAKTEKIDTSKRKFLKIAAGTSLATALMYFLKKQPAGAAFFGSVPGPGTIAIKDASGNKVNPSIQQPLDGYNVSDIDTTGATQYIGFLNKDSAWYILQINPDNSIRYVKGATNYSTPTTGAWATRGSQSYGTFSDIF